MWAPVEKPAATEAAQRAQVEILRQDLAATQAVVESLRARLDAMQDDPGIRLLTRLARRAPKLFSLALRPRRKRPREVFASVAKIGARFLASLRLARASRQTAARPDLTEVHRRELGLDIPLRPGRKVAVGMMACDIQVEKLRRAVSAAQIALSQAKADGSIWLMDGAASTQDALSKDAPIHYLLSRNNIGFGAGHNELMAAAFAAGAEAYIVLNPDGLLHPRAVEALLRMMDANNGRALIEAVRFPDEHPKDYDRAALNTPWASSACLLLPRAVYETIGGFDPDFFLYCEDVDLSWRARAAGFAVKICPPAIFLHQATNRPLSAKNEAQLAASSIRLAQKWGSPEFEAAQLQKLRNTGAELAVCQADPLPLDHQSLADFSNGHHFGPTRW